MAKVTKELAAAVKAVTRLKNLEFRESLCADIRSRAREMVNLAIGAPLTPMQVEYVQLLRSRLADFVVAGTEEAKAFTSAWDKAYRG